MTQVNLLPPELRQRQQTRRQTALVAVGGVLIAAILVFLYVLQVLRLNEVNEKVAAQEAKNQSLRSEIAELQRFDDLRNQLEARKAIVASAVSNTVRWSGVLRDVSLVLPDNMWLTSLTGTVQGGTPVAGAAPTTTPTVTPGGLIGNIQFEGQSLDKPTIALWLTRLEEVNGWVNAWLQSAADAAIGTTPVVTFTSTVDLSQSAAVPGGQL